MFCSILKGRIVTLVQFGNRKIIDSTGSLVAKRRFSQWILLFQLLNWIIFYSVSYARVKGFIIVHEIQWHKWLPNYTTQNVDTLLKNITLNKKGTNAFRTFEFQILMLETAQELQFWGCSHSYCWPWWSVTPKLINLWGPHLFTVQLQLKSWCPDKDCVIWPLGIRIGPHNVKQNISWPEIQLWPLISTLCH